MGIPEKIFVVGRKGSGKTEFAHALSHALNVATGHAADEQGFGVSECSHVLIYRLAKLCSSMGWISPVPNRNPSLADWVKFLLKHKESNRAALLELGAQLAKDSPGLILTEACSGGRIVVGARRQAEVYGYYALAKNRGGYGLAAWQGGNHAWMLVDRPGDPREQPEFDDSFFRLQICRYTVFNTGDVAGLKDQAVRLAEELCKSN